VNKRELVAEVSARTKLPAAEVAAVLDAVLDLVRRAVTRGDKVVLSGFGTFHRRTRARRIARDIWAGESITVKPTNVPSFRPGKPFKDAVARRRPARAPAARSRKAT
jgi:DNA-binding protein HU-beta